MNVCTWVMADGTCWRETLLARRAVRVDTSPDERVLPLGTAFKEKHAFTRLPDWRETPAAATDTFTGPLTTGGIPAARPVTGAAPKGNSGEQGAGESLPTAKDCLTVSRPSLAQPKTAPQPLAPAALLPWHPPKETPQVKTAPPRPAPPKATQSPADGQGALF